MAAKKITDEIHPEPEPEITTTPEITEAEISAKVRAGLTREQALTVINNQRAHDADL